MNPDHSHDQVCEKDEKYEAYIRQHLETLKEKCSKLTDCIDKLLAEESAIVVLKGENISLNKTCGLVFKPENGNYTTLRGKCSAIEREEIRSNLEEGLSTQIDTNRTWNSVNKCLRLRYGDSERTTRVEEICKLAKSKREICNSTTTHRTVETFFNTEIQDLQCKCKLISTPEKTELSQEAIIGIGIGCFVVLLAIFCILLFCYRRKLKRKSKPKNPNVVYKAAPGSDAIYQELYDDQRYRDFAKSSTGNPPTLPSRYVHHSSFTTEDDSGYLEPMMAGMKYRPVPALPGQASNPGYESPPRYSQYEKESNVVVNEGDDGYFKPLPDPDIGAAGRGPPAGLAKQESGGYDEIHGSHSSLPLEDAPVPAGPMPAKRNAVDSKPPESPYYVLEEGGGKDDRNTV